jgi:hypothetical protein
VETRASQEDHRVKPGDDVSACVMAGLDPAILCERQMRGLDPRI